MIFEIINPSDVYTLKADDFETACLAAVGLGLGKYGLRQIGGELEMPIFLFGGLEYLESWWQSQFKHSFKDEAPGIAVADCLDTVLIGKAASRASYEKGLELIADPVKQAEWRDHWHEERRSSMNDIGARAWLMAARIRQTHKAQP